MKKLTALLLISILTLAMASTVLAHPGGLDSKGGHYNRKTGQYHRHR